MSLLQEHTRPFDGKVVLEALYQAVVQSHVWVAAAVTSLAAYATKTEGLPSSKLALAVVCAATLLIYNLDSYLDATSDSTRARRARALAIGSALVLILLLSRAPAAMALLVTLGAAVCCCYAIPLTPRGSRLKDVPGTKSLFVGISVASAVVLVPLSARGFVVDANCLRAFALVACLTVVNATLFDVRDLHKDRQARLRTLPVLFGAKRTRVALAVGATLPLSWLASTSMDSSPEILCCWLACLLGSALLTEDSPRAAYALLVDGALFLPWLLG